MAVLYGNSGRPRVNMLHPHNRLCSPITLDGSANTEKFQKLIIGLHKIKHNSEKATKQRKTRQNKTALVRSSFTALGDDTRWAYILQSPRAHAHKRNLR